MSTKEDLIHEALIEITDDPWLRVLRTDDKIFIDEAYLSIPKEV